MRRGLYFWAEVSSNSYFCGVKNLMPGYKTKAIPCPHTMHNLGEAILLKMGKLHLYLRYRGGQAEQALHRKYEGQLRNAGLVLLFDLLMALAVVVAVAVVAGVLYLVLS